MFKDVITLVLTLSNILILTKDTSVLPISNTVKVKVVKVLLVNINIVNTNILIDKEKVTIVV